MRSIIKKNLKRILQKYGGFHISRMRSDIEDVMAHLKKQGVYPKTVFDIGVADGTPELYQAFSDSYFVLVEPLKEFERDMVSISGQYHMDYVLAAASDEVGSMNFNVHPDLCGSSLLQETEGAHVDGVMRTVPTVRLDTLAKERNLTPPYLIKVDVQGGELKVMAGASGILEQTDAVILEVSLFGFFIGGPQFADIITAMKSYDFMVYEIFDARNRPLDGALAQVDILFVREDSPLRQHHSYANKEQRELQNKKIRRILHQ